MIRLFYLYQYFTRAQKIKLIFLQLLVVISAFAEASSVIIVGPFIEYISLENRLDSQNIIVKALSFFEAENSISLIKLSLILISFLLFSTVLSMYSIWRLSIYGQEIGARISSELYRNYIFQKWSFHSSNNSSNLVSNISLETLRLTDSVIVPFLIMVSKIILAFAIMVLILIYDFWIGVSAMIFFSIFYAGIYLLMTKIFEQNGKDISQSQEQRIKLMNEGFEGIRELILANKREIFFKRFLNQSLIFANAKGLNLAFSQIPKFLVEFLAITIVFVIIALQVEIFNEPLTDLIPIASILVLAVFKLLPAFQQIYFALSSVKGNIQAFSSVQADLLLPINYESNKKRFSPSTISICLENISFFHKNSTNYTLQNISFEIDAGSKVGIIGSSGSGKSTLIDLISGLLEPSSGSFLINEVSLNDISKNDYFKCIGYVSQHIFLLDSTIEDNIVFAFEGEEIDSQRLRLSIKLANLEEFISSLPSGLNTKVGERGMQLSGGQRQRIAIARALYNNPPLLILDEATSALDGPSEAFIMQSLYELDRTKTILLVAHRISTIMHCDKIFLLKNGQIADSGTYHELLERNKSFFQTFNN